MSYESEQFLIRVQQHARGVSFDEAQRITQVVLGVLGDRIAQGEARDIAAQLPPEIAPYLAGSRDAEGFSAEEFVDRVAQALDVDAETAQTFVRAVFNLLRAAIEDDEYEDLVAELPSDYAALLPTGAQIDIVSYDAFLERVAEHAAVDRDTAGRVADAVLEALAQRIAGGEVEDLIRHLPRELHEPLRRGLERSGGKPRKLKLDDFLQLVAEAEGVDPITARDHVHGAFVALRDAVGDAEFFDVTSELPQNFQELLVR
jgi:uncharacterized protein (DUF2267 family)